MGLNSEEKNQLMNELKQQAIENNREPSFFLIARDLTLLDYFSTEVGAVKI